MITATLRDGLAESLRMISRQNNYETDPIVIVEPTALRDVPVPCVALAGAAGGSSKPDQLTNGAGHAEQEFVVQLIAKSGEEMDALLDDVRNATEGDASPLATVSGVEMVTLSQWSHLVHDEDLNLVICEAMVEVRYCYARGGA